MTIKFVAHLICILVLVSVLFSAVAYAEVTMGVKQGDWVEYNVKCTGPVPEEHDLTWAKMEFVRVEGKTADVKITSRYTNGSEKDVTMPLNLETGQTGDSFLIPANLNEGDTFVEQYHGTMLILKIEERAYAGAKRSSVNGATPETVFYWDQMTGVLLEARSTYADFSIDTKAEKTNIWQPETVGVDPTIVVAFMAVVIVAVLVVFIILKMKK